MDVFVGIDAGTTGAKAALFDDEGNELGSGYCDYPCLHPHPGWAEQEVDAVWRGLCDAQSGPHGRAPKCRINSSAR